MSLLDKAKQIEGFGIEKRIEGYSWTTEYHGTGDSFPTQEEAVLDALRYLASKNLSVLVGVPQSDQKLDESPLSTQEFYDRAFDLYQGISRDIQNRFSALPF